MPADTGEAYDLVVVGGGISGLAAAYFFRKAAGATAKILILDNHDDFGGHAKRNEFTHRRPTDDRLRRHAIDRYALAIQRGVARPPEGTGHRSREFYTAFDQKLYGSLSLGGGVFFDREQWAADPWSRAVPEGPGPVALNGGEISRSSALLRSGAPRLHPVLESARGLHARALGRRRNGPGCGRSASAIFFAITSRSIRRSFPTSSSGRTRSTASELRRSPPPHRLRTADFKAWACRPARNAQPSAQGRPRDPYIFHFPDGNASIARLLVRSLIPPVAPGRTMEDIVSARFDYARLDDAASPVRIRLNSTGVRVRHLGDPESAKEVAVTYVRGGKAHRVRARACVLACYHSVIPRLAPELPEDATGRPALRRESAAGLHQRPNPQLDVVPETGRQQYLRPVDVLRFGVARLSGEPRRLQVSDGA